MTAERSQKREIMLGAAALAILVFVFFGIFFLADVRRLFTRTDTLHVLMPSASGLRAGSLVWIAGQTVGEVKDIEVRSPGADQSERVHVRIDVERRHLEHIRADSDARVTSFRIIGDPVLDITPGSSSAAALEEGDTLRMRAGGTTANAKERARALQANLRELVAQTRELAPQARQRVTQANRLRRQLHVTAREFRDFVFAMQKGALNTLSDPEFNQILSDLNTTLRDLQTSFQRASERARRAGHDAGPAFDRLAARTDTIQLEIGKLQTAMTAGGGGLVRAQTDSAIVKGLHRAQLQLDSLIAATKRNPLRFWF